MQREFSAQCRHTITSHNNHYAYPPAVGPRVDVVPLLRAHPLGRQMLPRVLPLRPPAPASPSSPSSNPPSRRTATAAAPSAPRPLATPWCF